MAWTFRTEKPALKAFNEAVRNVPEMLPRLIQNVFGDWVVTFKTDKGR